MARGLVHLARTTVKNLFCAPKPATLGSAAKTGPNGRPRQISGCNQGLELRLIVSLSGNCSTLDNAASSVTRDRRWNRANVRAYCFTVEHMIIEFSIEVGLATV